MAFAEKYYSRMVDLKDDSITWRVSYYEEGFGGAAIELQHQHPGFELEYGDPNQELYDVNLSSSLRWHFFVKDGTEEAILTDAESTVEGNARLELRRDGVLVWRGDVLTDLIVIQERAYAYPATLSAGDGLTALKGLDYTEPITASSGFKQTTQSILENQTDAIGYGFGSHYATAWSARNPIDETYNDIRQLVKFTDITQDDTAITIKEVLDHLCRRYALRYFQWKEDWHFVQADSYINESATFQDETNNNFGGYGTVTINADNPLQGSQSESTFLKRLKRAQITYNHNTRNLGLYIAAFDNTDSPQSTSVNELNTSGVEILTINSRAWFPTSGTVGITISLNEGDFSAAIVGVNQGSKIFTIDGNYMDQLEIGEIFTVSGSTGNDGDYTVLDVAYDSGNDETVVTVSEIIPDATVDGTGAWSDLVYWNAAKGEWQYTSIENDISIPYISDYSLETDVLPNSNQSTLTVQISLTGTGGTDAIDIVLSNTTAVNSTAITTEGTSNITASADADLGTVQIGTGPSTVSLGDVKDYANHSIGANWARAGSSQSLTLDEILLQTVLNLQGGKRRKLEGKIWAYIQPTDAISWNSLTMIPVHLIITNTGFTQGAWVEVDYDSNTITYTETTEGTTSASTAGGTGGSTGSVGGASELNDLIDVTLGTPITAEILQYDGSEWVDRSYLDMKEISAPANPAADTMRIYALDEHGKTELHVADPNGNTHVVMKDNYEIVRNMTGAQLDKGTAVYISGQTGDVSEVSKAQADDPATMPCTGILAEDIADNGYGRMMLIGVIENFDTSAWTAGDDLYVSAASAGALVTTAPSVPTNIEQRVGLVHVSGVGNGKIQVTIHDAEGVERGTRYDYTFAETVTINGTQLFTKGEEQALGVRDNVAFGNNIRSFFSDNTHYGWFGAYRDDGIRGGYFGYGDGANELSLVLDNASEFEIIGGDLFLSGKFGVGVSPLVLGHFFGATPIIRVEASGGSQEAQLHLDAHDNTGSAGLYFTRVSDSSTNFAKIAWTGGTTGKLDFYTDAAFALRIDENQNILFGTTTQTHTGVNLASAYAIGTENYALTTDFSGTGWKASGGGNFNIANLTVREAARFRELIIDQLAVIAGSDLLSVARGKIASINTGSNQITLEDPNDQGTSRFAVNDFFWIKSVDIDNTTIIDLKGQITAISGVTLTLDTTVTGGTHDGGTTDISFLSVGDVIVQRGSSSDTDRQALIYRTVSDSDAPVEKYFTGIDSLGAFDTVSNISTQLGVLDGLTSTYGNVSGEGLFSSKAFLTDSVLIGDLSKSGHYMEYASGDLTIDAAKFSLSALISNVGIDIDSATQSIIAGDLDEQRIELLGASGKMDFYRSTGTDSSEKVLTIDDDIFGSGIGGIHWDDNQLAVFGNLTGDLHGGIGYAEGGSTQTFAVLNEGVNAFYDGSSWHIPDNTQKPTLIQHFIDTNDVQSYLFFHVSDVAGQINSNDIRAQIDVEGLTIAPKNDTEKLYFGSSKDTNLYRNAANVLKTDDSLSIGTDLSVAGDATVTGAAAFQSDITIDKDIRFSGTSGGLEFNRIDLGVGSGDTTLSIDGDLSLGIAVIIAGNDNIGTFACLGTFTNLLSANSSNTFSTVRNNSGTINVYYYNSEFRIQNNSSSSRGITVILLKQ